MQWFEEKSLLSLHEVARTELALNEPHNETIVCNKQGKTSWNAEGTEWTGRKIPHCRPSRVQTVSGPRARDEQQKE
jgi:hypothetical protein